MEIKRTPFQNLPGEENPQFLQDGIRIFKEMRVKYPNDNDIDLDNILNGLCAALMCLMRGYVPTSNHRQFLQLIHKILDKNVRLNEEINENLENETQSLTPEYIKKMLELKKKQNSN